MHRVYLPAVFLTFISLSAMAASSPDELKSQLAAARTEAVNSSSSNAAPIATAPSGQRQMLAEMHDDMQSSEELAAGAKPSIDMDDDSLVPIPSPVATKPTSLPKAQAKSPAHTTSVAAVKSSAAPVSAAVPTSMQTSSVDAMDAPTKSEMMQLPTSKDYIQMPQTPVVKPPVQMTPVSKIMPVASTPAAPKQNNTDMALADTAIMPSTKTISTDTLVPAPVMHKSFTGFKPPAAAAKGAWRTRVMNQTTRDPKDAFCLIENNFDNDLILMIAQRQDGYSTLGLNYGIDMLQPGKTYQVSVRIDDMFDETFVGNAESSRTLVVQMGKKPSFFNTLPNSQAVRIAIPGAASTFSIQGIIASLPEFSNCIAKIGGSATPIAPAMAAPTMPAVPANPVMTQDMPAPGMATASVATPSRNVSARTASKPIDLPVAMPKRAAAPVAPMMADTATGGIASVHEDDSLLPSERINMSDKGVSTNPTVSQASLAMPPASTMAIDLPPPEGYEPHQPVSAPALPPVARPMANAKTGAEISDESGLLPSEQIGRGTVKPSSMPMPIDLPAAKSAPVPASSGWSNSILSVIRQSGVQTSGLQQNPSMIEWTDGSGMMHGQALRVSGNDIIDAATNTLDQAEKNCKGTFTSQIGAPDEMGGLTTLAMESKCTSQGNSVISAWLLHKDSTAITAWEMQTSRNQRDLVFQTRSQLLDALKNTSAQK